MDEEVAVQSPRNGRSDAGGGGGGGKRGEHVGGQKKEGGEGTQGAKTLGSWVGKEDAQ